MGAIWWPVGPHRKPWHIGKEESWPMSSETVSWAGRNAMTPATTLDNIGVLICTDGLQGLCFIPKL